ncbi:alcohol dehydrogenase family protein [Saccharopolyspora hordei]|uniref:NADPH:quinone reductase-like Zn-dependent oxidoreductase n=1 Tax=Saccharopolyspora hordei TaxID=1838 RepID=A0A853AT27_9PSEU|nr:alcohol dehydrogenase family protein [Saccharopolyspora hordei]NYI85717.1 NADPH:quinone reductase-like Zn-dependent oxidoreductase [Saccharopolyspora hordei]
MRAVLLTGFGGPEKLEYRDDVPAPEPGPGEVRVRVAATGINNTDVWTREGAYGSAEDPTSTAGWRREPLAFPRIQGADVVGRIDQVGEGVPRSRLGERVLVDPMLYTGGERELVDTEYLGSERDGGFADFTTVPAGNAHPVQSRLSDAELATFPTACTTAMRMLNRADVRAGETVVVTGASGGVGSALVQLATLRGARVVAVTSSAKRERALRLGAHATVDRDAPDLAAAVRAEVGPVDVVADVVAGPAFAPLLRVLGPLGRYVVAGGIAGPLVETDLRTVYLRQLQLIGSSFGTHEDFAQLVDHVQRGELTPLLAGTYPLPELREAQRAFAAKDFFGKLVITVEGSA